MFETFIIPATLAGIGVSLATAPLGCLVVWRRMAYFGDATAHAAMLGVAISIILSADIFYGVLAVALFTAITVSTLSGRGYAMDTLLGVIAHSAIAVGLVAISFLKDVDIDLEAYLFGDISAITVTDIGIIWAGAALVLALIAWRWSALLTATLNEDLAYSSGINPKREQLILTLALAIVVAVSIKIMGALLITAMLIIPAATARPFSKSPEAMVLLTTCIGMASAFIGIQVSYVWETPTGPTIVCVAALLFVFSNVLKSARQTG